MSTWEFSDALDAETWRPLLQWTEDDVIEIHKRHSAKPNPLYMSGHKRVGCWPCIFSIKSEIKQIAKTDPERIDQIETLEKEVTREMQKRAQEKGVSLKLPSSTFFYRPGIEPGIRNHVIWANTARGGRQFELFEEEPPSDCVRWGLCEQRKET